MTAFSKFPLLRLPNKAILQTIRMMDFDQILEFSLISKKCKNIVISIKFEKFYIGVYIGADIRIWVGSEYYDPIYFFYYYMGGNQMESPGDVFISDDFEFSIVRKLNWTNSFSMKNWVQHLLTIFNCRTIDDIRFQDCASKFDINGIRRAFGNCHLIDVQDTKNFEYNRSILRKFSHIEKINIDSVNVFEDSKIPQEVLIQNWNSLFIDEKVKTVMTLDELLLINSKSVEIWNLQTSLKDLNRLLKLWQKGALPRLKDLIIYYLNGDEEDEEEILKGIKRKTPVNIGVEVQRNDGIKALVRITHPQYAGIVLHCFQMGVRIV